MIRLHGTALGGSTGPGGAGAWMTTMLSMDFPGAVVGGVEVEPLSSGTNAHARLHLTYVQGGGPPSVFVKRPGRATSRMALVALRAYATEARLAASRQPLPLAHPTFYAGAVDRVRMGSVVVMEDLSVTGGRPNDGLRPLSVDEVRDGLEGLARLHGHFLDRRRAAVLGFLRPWRLGRLQSMASVASLARGLRSARSVAGPGIVPTTLGASALSAQFSAWARRAASGDQTVLHGDPHPANTYGLPGDTTGFLDWQLARIGHWSHDVGYFVAGSLDPADRRAHERELLHGYLDALGAAGAAPGDRDAAWDRYRASAAYGLATWLHTLSFGTFHPVELCVAMITRYAAAYADLDSPTATVWRDP